MRNRIRRALRALIAGSLCTKTEPPGSSPRPNAVAAKVRGTILQIDPLGREVVLVVNGAAMSFHVPLDSIVRLNGKRIKLRMLEPLDQAQVLYTVENAVPIAHAITAHWGSDSSEGPECEGAQQPAADEVAFQCRGRG